MRSCGGRLGTRRVLERSPHTARPLTTSGNVNMCVFVFVVQMASVEQDARQMQEEARESLSRSSAELKQLIKHKVRTPPPRTPSTGSTPRGLSKAEPLMRVWWWCGCFIVSANAGGPVHYHQQHHQRLRDQVGHMNHTAHRAQPPKHTASPVDHSRVCVEAIRH